MFTIPARWKQEIKGLKLTVTQEALVLYGINVYAEEGRKIDFKVECGDEFTFLTLVVTPYYGQVDVMKGAAQGQKDMNDRDEEIYRLCKEGYSQKDIVEKLGLSVQPKSLSKNKGYKKARAEMKAEKVDIKEMDDKEFRF